jgi:hypothetical protein
MSKGTSKENEHLGGTWDQLDPVLILIEFPYLSTDNEGEDCLSKST